MEKFTKKIQISALNEGDSVDDIFVVKIKKGISQYVKGYAFDLLLSDNSGKTVDYKYWGSQDEARVKVLYDTIKSDSVVHVQGKVGFYAGKRQVTTNEPFIIEVLQEEQYDKADFVKPARKNLDKMFEELMKYTDTVSDDKLKLFLKSVFSTEIKKKFMEHPGAIEIHHNWTGGLMEHVLEILKYCETSWELHPELDKDLLIAGALLHDIGKLEELEVTSRIKGTVKGQLIGHLSLGAAFVSKRLEETDIDDIMKNKLLHLIIAHHGKLEYGSPKEPMIPEAFVLFYSDIMSAKAAEMIEFVKDSREDTEDDFMYYRREKRNIYLK